jgi:hypothetical protein
VYGAGVHFYQRKFPLPAEEEVVDEWWIYWIEKYGLVSAKGWSDC